MSIKRVAAYNATPSLKATADYVCSGQNDQLILQQAATQAGANGLLELSDGTFSLAGRVQLTCSLIGRPGTLLKRQPGWNGQLLDWFDAPSPRVSDFDVDDGGDLADPAGQGVMALRFWHSDGATMERVRVRNGYRLPLTISSSDVRIANCWFNDARGLTLAQGGHGGHGLAVDAQGGWVKNVTITDCTFKNNWRSGFCIHGVDGLRVSGNTFDGNMPKAAFDAGIERGGQIGFSNCHQVKIIGGNHLTGGWYTQGIEYQVIPNYAATSNPTEDVLIEGNTVEYQGIAGILVFLDKNAPVTPAWLRIANNIITNCDVLSPKEFAGQYGAITIWDRITNVAVDCNTVRSRVNPALRFGGRNDHYHWLGNEFNLTGGGTIIADLNPMSGEAGAPTNRKWGTNILTLNGVAAS
jgi:parallel beta-helix repeat protein